VKGRWAVLAGTVLLLSSLNVSAGDEDERASSRRGGPDEAFRLVDEYMVSNLQSSLGLSDETSAKAIPLVKDLQEARRGFFVERGKALRRLRGLLQSGTATREEVLSALDAVKKIDAAGPVRIREAQEALDAILSPMEQAKYRVLELDVERRLRDLMGRARRDRPRREEKR